MGRVGWLALAAVLLGPPPRCRQGTQKDHSMIGVVVCAYTRRYSRRLTAKRQSRCTRSAMYPLNHITFEAVCVTRQNGRL